MRSGEDLVGDALYVFVESYKGGVYSELCFCVPPPRFPVLPLQLQPRGQEYRWTKAQDRTPTAVGALVKKPDR